MSKSMESTARKSVTPSVNYRCPKQIFTKLWLFQLCFVKNIYVNCFEKPRDLTADSRLHAAGWMDMVFKKALFLTSYRKPKSSVPT
jgi:hypothetical protein